MPERIWAWDETGRTCEDRGFREGGWTTEPDRNEFRAWAGAVEYTRAAIATLAAEAGHPGGVAVRAHSVSDILRDLEAAIKEDGGISEMWARVKRDAPEAHALMEAAIYPEGQLFGWWQDKPHQIMYRVVQAAALYRSALVPAPRDAVADAIMDRLCEAQTALNTAREGDDATAWLDSKLKLDAALQELVRQK